MLPINSELINQFLNYKVEYYHISPKTYQLYTSWLKIFADFLENDGLNLVNADAPAIIKYKNSFKHVRPDTLKSYLAAVQSFYTWASDPTIKVVPTNPCPPMRLESSPAHPNVIPTAASIFKVRQRITSLRDATVIELLLSSGMRISEMMQLRVCDLNFGCNITDFELEITSPYIGGWIELSPSRGLQTKRGKYRTVFFSKLAAKLIKRYIACSGVDINGVCPLFPFKKQDLYYMIRKAGRGLVGKGKQDESKYQRKAGFLDIDVHSIEATDAYREMLRKSQDAERKKLADSNGMGDAAKPMASRGTYLHPHSLRHFFAVVQYYRNYYGNRRDLVTLRDLLGHSSTDQTNVYVTSQPVVTSEAEWKRIFNGNGFEYREALSGGKI